MIKQIRKAINIPIFDNSGELPDVFISGVARSGTTWLADIINYRKNYRMLFEPFDPDRNPDAKPLGHFPSGIGDRFYVEKILSGKSKNRWVNTGNDKLYYKYRLIKDVRTNYILPSLAESYPTLKLVLIIRNPREVVHSWQRLGWSCKMDRIRSNKELLSRFPEINEGLKVLRPNSEVDNILFQWATMNFVALKTQDIYTVAYSDVKSRDDATITKLFSFLKIDLDKDRLKNVLDRPSDTTKLKEEKKEGREGFIDGSRLLEICEFYGLKNYLSE